METLKQTLLYWTHVIDFENYCYNSVSLFHGREYFNLHILVSMLHGLLLHKCSCIHVIWFHLNIWSDCSCIIVINMTLLLPEHGSNWYKMYGTNCHTEQSATPHMWWEPHLESTWATSRIPRLMDLMPHVILLPVISIVVTV